MYKIKVMNHISSTGLNLFPDKLYKISTDMVSPDAILVRSHSMHEMIFPDSLKVIGRAGTGVNNIPISKLTQLGIPVLNAIGANANAVRELVIAGMLLASRHICQAWDYVRSLESNNDIIEHHIEQNKKKFVGFELFGKTLAVIGLGSVGVKVANAAINLGMHVIGYDPTITVNRAWELSAGVEQSKYLESALQKADLITFHVPLTEETRYMINASRFHLMKKGTILLNFARASIIHHEDLLDAINQEKILAYITDFPSAELKNHPRVITLPHLGASTREAEENCAIMIVKQIRHFLEQGNITHSVNFPTIDMPNNQAGVRLSIVNENIPNIVAQISSKLASAGLNIVGLQNGSCHAIAYTLIDINTDIHSFLLNEIAAIQGVIRVRKITPILNTIDRLATDSTVALD